MTLPVPDDLPGLNEPRAEVAVIDGARIAAAHDGVAELLVSLRFPQGGRSEVVLDAVGAEALMQACGAVSVDALVGHGWERVRDALAVSWNRFAGSTGHQEHLQSNPISGEENPT